MEAYCLKILDFLNSAQNKVGEWLSSPLFGQLKESLSDLDVKEKVNLRQRLLLGASLFSLIIVMILMAASTQPVRQIASSLTSPLISLHPLTEDKRTKEVFGFAPFWTFDKLGNVDFDTLTTLAYFGVPVLSNGDLDRSDFGYQTFKSREATDLFKKAHAHGTRVVLTITQMDNWPIEALLDDPQAQDNAIAQITYEVQSRGVDGVNVDMEYQGDPGDDYRQKFTRFVARLTEEMHRQNPNSKVTVSVYAASVKDPKIYDVRALAKVSDGIFMMAYDFANASSDTAMPTAPLRGAKEGQYWYDVSSAVDDFLTVMPANKLILGVPWYGYNYPVYEPGVKSQTFGRTVTQTYEAAQENVKPDREDILDYQEGWDNFGEVGFRAYYTASGIWRMIFLEDGRSLGIKYDFAKSKNLGGVGIWALGFDGNQGDLWSVLREKFGQKIADASLVQRAILAEE
ncbi:MAG: glycosyl hydrolase family 18 protein [bacterium]|nr:glycosyl hydrolase family 18 protein [bacterium]